MDFLAFVNQLGLPMALLVFAVYWLDRRRREDREAYSADLLRLQAQVKEAQDKVLAMLEARIVEARQQTAVINQLAERAALPK